MAHDNSRRCIDERQHAFCTPPDLIPTLPVRWGDGLTPPPRSVQRRVLTPDVVGRQSLPPAKRSFPEGRHRLDSESEGLPDDLCGYRRPPKITAQEPGGGKLSQSCSSARSLKFTVRRQGHVELAQDSRLAGQTMANNDQTHVLTGREEWIAGEKQFSQHAGVLRCVTAVVVVEHDKRPGRLFADRGDL